MRKTIKIFDNEVEIGKFIQIVGCLVSAITLLVLILLTFSDIEYSTNNPYVAFIYALIPLFTTATKVRLNDNKKIEWISTIGFFLGILIGTGLLIWSLLFTFTWEPVVIAVAGEFYGSSIAGFLLVTTDI